MWRERPLPERIHAIEATASVGLRLLDGVEGSASTSRDGGSGGSGESTLYA